MAEDKENDIFEDISALPMIQKLISMTVQNSDGFIRIKSCNQVFPKCMKSYLTQIKEFEVREDDVWISSFPKCGTTWTQEMVWCLKNKLNLTKAKSKTLDERVPYLELSAISPTMSTNSVHEVSKCKSPRIIKTHLALEMLPQSCLKNASKIIYITRNPRDVCVSLYHHYKLLETYTGSFEEFAELFLNDLSGFYAPFISHVLSYWKNRSLPNMLFITYEEMNADLASVIKRTASFLDVKINEEEVKVLQEHLSFESMKKNSAVNKEDFVAAVNQDYEQMYGTCAKGQFMRKGMVGNWKDYISGDLLEHFIQWESNGLSSSDFKFSFK